MFPYFQFTTISVGFINIQVWGLLVSLGMILSIIIIWKQSKINNLPVDKMLDLAFYLLIFGIIFARLFHILFYAPGYFFSNPIEIFKIWNGGMSSFGGVFGAVGVFIFLIKKWKVTKSDVLKMTDLFSFSALFGWFIGRFGCFLIHDHVGKLSNSWLAVKFSTGARLDMALMEILGLLPLVILFLIIRKKRLLSGFYFYILLLYYGLLRFILDFFRMTNLPGSDVRYLGLTPGQYFGMILVIIGMFFLLRKRNNVEIS